MLAYGFKYRLNREKFYKIYRREEHKHKLSVGVTISEIKAK